MYYMRGVVVGGGVDGILSRFEQNLLDDIRNDLQDLLDALPNIFIILRDGLPNRRMVRLSGNTPINHLLTSLLSPMLLLEL